MRIEEIKEIIDICMKVNGTEVRTKEETGELPTVFFSFSGHIACMYVDVHEHGWESGESATKEFVFRTGEVLTYEKMEEFKRYMDGLYDRTF